MPAQARAISQEEYANLHTLGAFARRTYGNEGKDYGAWKQIHFQSSLTGDVSPNGLNNFLTGFQAHAWVNHARKEIVFAISGTNDLRDVLSWPTSLTGHTYGQVKDAILAAKRINALVDGEDAHFPGYHVRVTGHSLGGELAQVAAATYGWDGASFDGPGAGAIIDGKGYQAFVKAHDITPVGRTGHFVDVNIDSDGVYGGSLVGSAGYDVPGVDKHYYTRSEASASLSQWHRDFSEQSWRNIGYLPGKLLCGVLVHFLDFIRQDIVNGHIEAHEPTEDRIYIDQATVETMHKLFNGGQGTPAAMMSVADKEDHAGITNVAFNRFGHALQTWEGNAFSSAWTLASKMMQLHLEENESTSSAQISPMKAILQQPMMVSGAMHEHVAHMPQAQGIQV